MQVAKDIKYADKQPVVPWGPRYELYLCGAMHFKFFSPVLPLFIVYDPIINHRLNLNEKIMNLIIA
jgi:hypothetical protein